MKKPTLAIVKRNADGSVIAMHHFGTGWQELVFSSEAAARSFAVAEGCQYLHVFTHAPARKAAA